MDNKFFLPLTKPFYDDEEANAARSVVDSGWVSQGPRVQEFEQRFAEYCGVKHAVAVANCTAALHLALVVAGIGPGDEVICPSLSFIATANSISYVGGIPVFCEVEPESFNLDTTKLAQHINAKTRAIIAVHQMGLPCDLSQLQALCKERNLILIEDAACAVGSEYHGQRIGAHSDLVCFSFHPRKVLTTGEGGMITTSRADYAEQLLSLRQHAMSEDAYSRHLAHQVQREHYWAVGYNYRMTDIQAAIGIVQLRKMGQILSRRRELGALYAKGLQGCSEISFPKPESHALTNYQSYWLKLHDNAKLGRDELMQSLLAKGIATRHGIMCAHREAPYVKRFGRVSLPISEALSDCSLLLPLFPAMSNVDVNFVVESILESLGY